MATLRLSNLGDGYVQWTISGLSNNFTTANGYISAGITGYQFTQSNPSIYGVVSEVWAGTSGGKSVTGTEYVGAGRHQYWAFTQGDSMYYPAGSASVTITEGPDRPYFFSWLRGLISYKPSTNELSRGGAIPPYLNAAGWNTYTANINEVRDYLGLPWYSFTSAVAGRTELSAAMVNQAINAIKAMSPAVSPPGLATSMSTPGSATLLNKLVDSLNSVT